tara:strand:- start:628 stop:1254 length:627 start_codon:yes stop_codon:yes gene_type:complete
MNKTQFEKEAKQIATKICEYARGEVTIKNAKGKIEDMALALLNSIYSLKGITSIESAIVKLCDMQIHMDINNPLDKQRYMAGRAKISSDDEIVSARSDKRTAIASVYKKAFSSAKRARDWDIDCREFDSVKKLNESIELAKVIEAFVEELDEVTKDFTKNVKTIRNAGNKADCEKATSVIRRAMIALRTTEVKATKVSTKKSATTKVA